MAKKAPHAQLIHEELEPRLLFSAGLETVLLDDNLPGTEPAIVETVSESETEILQLEQNQQANSESEPASEVVFIDENVENYDQLMADLANKDNIDVYILDSSVDGIEQISAVLENYQDLDAIHLISHGNEEGLLLGNGTLDNNNIDSYSDTISGWQSALSEQADLLIYGCDVAAGEQGLALLEKLNNLTGTDIAASDDLTGNAALSGDWEFEYRVGELETSLIFSTQIQSDWQGTLASPDLSNIESDILAYSEGDGAVAIDQGSDTSVSDGGAMNDFSPGDLTVGITVGGDTAEDVLSIQNQGTGAGQIGFDGTTVTYEGVTIGTATGGTAGADLAITFSGGPSESAVAALMQNITYENTDTDNPTTTARTVAFTLTNDEGSSDTDTTTVNVTAVNDAPLNSVPGMQSVNEDTTLTFSSSNGNLISVSDVDVSGDVQVTLGVTNGTLSLSGTTGLTFTTGDGTSDSSMVFTGSVANVNTALAGMSYTGNANWNGAETLSITTSDQGGYGTGGTLTDTDNVTITVNAVNDAPTGAVSITGTVTEDQTLTADASGLADADGLGAFSYQWQRDGVDIGGATASTYTLGDADVGAAMTVKVTYTDGNGTAESVTSSATGAVANVNDAPTGGVSIMGTVTEDQTLTADTSGLADADGLGAFSYQWQRDGVDIGGATASTYTLADVDVGAAITVKTSYTDGNSTAENVTSGATAAVANVNDTPTGGVSITGTVTEDQTLTADTSGLADADGLGAFSYQWQRDGVDIGGATASTYALGDADVGANITVKTGYTDGNSTAENVTSGATAAVANVNDTPTGGVSITGTATEDQTLTADTSALADADGLGAFSYQWQRDGVDIGGATGNTYTLSNTDVGTNITVKTSYTDGQGTVENITSTATSAVAIVDNNSPTDSTNENPPPDNTVGPIVNDVNTPEAQADETTDSNIQEVVAIEESTKTEEIPVETDAVLDVDAEGQPTVLLKQGASELLHSLTGNQTNTGDSNATYISPADLAAEENVLIESVSPWQLDGPGINLDLQKALDELNQQLGSNGRAEESEGQVIITTMAGVSIGLTAGFVTWALQGSSLMTALLTTLPAWNTFDPLPVLNANSNRKTDTQDKEQYDGVDSVFDDMATDTDNNPKNK